MTFCKKCGAKLSEAAKFCPKCGVPVKEKTPNLLTQPKGFIVVTTPTVPGYQIQRVVGVVTGLTPRTRGVGGKIVAGFQSMLGGEVTAFSYEIEKARAEAMNRAIVKAKELGANAIVGLDMETSNVLQSLVLISATGTAVVVEPKTNDTKESA